tara:strand:+ start:2508 stop:2714 length:207 start_codon:yes stop_codon:yes gene_type:complete
MKVIFVIILITSTLNGKTLQEDTIALYEINTTLEICEKYIKPAFEQKKQTPPYQLEVKTECLPTMNNK